ncbi:hypothetical protein ASF71_14465 [Deinococcus sp. Leaf326]|nr:hypothetical protein ASF71_14465 [Deinococcus sp. Leaf326]
MPPLRPLAVSLLLGALLTSCAPLRPAVWTVEARQTRVTASGGRVLVNGRPFFPFGFYHISWADQGTPQTRLDDLDTLADAGFNVMLTEPVREAETEMPPLLARAQRRGVMILAHGIQPRFVRELAGQPALLGFTLMDDSNYNSTPPAVADLQATYKALAPDKLTGITLAVANDRPESGFFGVSDSVSNMSYPIGGTDEIAVVYGVMRQTVVQAARRGVVPLATLQTFAWPGQRRPTPAELRNMTYQAVVAGVKGVVYYSYRSGGNRVTDDGPLWQETRNLAAEMRVLSPTLLSAGRRELTPDTAGQPVRAVQFSGAGGSYLLVVNTTPRPQPLRLDLPRVRSLRPLFGTATPDFGRGQLGGTLEALGVQVFEVR